MLAMPIYEYACTACGERTEARQSFTEPPLETCAQCGGKLRKLYSPVGIVFKGSGFYSTDAKKSTDGKKTPQKEEKKPAASEAKKPDKTSPSGSDKK